jgi:hypothetical protein
VNHRRWVRITEASSSATTNTGVYPRHAFVLRLASGPVSADDAGEGQQQHQQQHQDHEHPAEPAQMREPHVRSPGPKKRGVQTCDPVRLKRLLPQSSSAFPEVCLDNTLHLILTIVTAGLWGQCSGMTPGAYGR